MNIALPLILLATTQDSAAVFEVSKAHGVEPSLVKIINEEVVTHMAKSKTFSKVVGSGDLKALLSLEQQKSALGCDETRCLAELGGALGVGYLVVPSLGKIGDSYLINLKLVDVEAATPLWRDRREVKQESDLVGAVKELSQALHVFRHPKASKNTWAPKLVATSGVVAASASLGHFLYTKQRYEDLPSRTNYQSAQAAQRIDQPLFYAGLVAGVLGSLWWVFQ